jgi:hypothetical protein
LEVAERLMVLTIDCALANNSFVIVRLLKGNHDEQSTVTVAHFLKAYYQNEPRVYRRESQHENHRGIVGYQNRLVGYQGEMVMVSLA